MKIIDFSELYQHEYSLEIIEHRFHWNTNATYDCTLSGHPANGLLFYVDIETTHTFENKVINFKKNDFVYFPCGIKYSSIYTKGEGHESEVNGINIKFILKDINGIEFTLSDEAILISDLVQTDYKNQLLDIVHLLSTNRPIMYIKAKVYELLTDLSLALNETNKPLEFQQIHNGVRFIEENYDRKITVGDAAKACYMSEGYFRKLFQKCMGTSPIKYINRLKLQKANTLLRSGLYSISEIAEAIGIDDPNYFSYFYKNNTKQSPSEIVPKFKKSNS